MSDTEFVHQPKRRRIEIEEDEDEYGGDSITEQPSDSHSISHGADGSDITLRQEEPQPLLEPPTPLDNQQEHTLKYEQAELPPLSLSLTTPSESLSSSSALLTSMPTTAPSPSVAFAEPLPPSSSSSSSVFTTPAPSKTGVHRQSTASSVLSTVRPSPAKSYKAGKKQEATSVLCDYCRKDIGHIVRIKCVDCDFTLCLECFAGGCQVFQHKNDHAYRVVDRVSIPIFEQDWGADEELVLLEAIEKHGFGNWADVAKNLRSKGQHKCEEHYHSVYLKDVPGEWGEDRGRGNDLLFFGGCSLELEVLCSFSNMFVPAFPVISHTLLIVFSSPFPGVFPLSHTFVGYAHFSLILSSRFLTAFPYSCA